MREPHKKGVAHHLGSESCASVRKEAWLGNGVRHNTLYNQFRSLGEARNSIILTFA